MNTALILLPDFLLIVLGWGLSRYSQFKRPAWEVLEKIVYWVLFPCMLINSTSRAVIDWSQNTEMLLLLGGCMAFAAFLGIAAKWFLHSDAIKIASGIQTTFRFNTYLAFAAASRLSGDDGTAIMAITVACLVPLANIMAVFSLARHSESHILSELARNPLIIATLTGLLMNVAGIHLPDVINLTISRLGNASIPLGLMTVGAGLVWLGSKRDSALVGYWTIIKLVILPACVFYLGLLIALPKPQLQNALLFASMPTATTCYVLANRMGGNGAIVSVAISVMTLLAAITVPFWLYMFTTI